MMKPITKGLLVAGLSVAMGVASTNVAAIVFNDFKVEEGAVGAPTVANEFTADKITGNYVEVITFGAGNTVDVSLKWEAGQFVANDGADPVVTQLGGFGAGGYGLYSLFQASGTFTPDGFGGGTFAFGPGGSLDVLVDADQDTTFGQPATGNLAWTTGNTADDLKVATGTVITGSGVLDPTLPSCDPGINCGSFGTTTTFVLDVAGLGSIGTTYFIDPVPFYNIAFESGQLNNFTPTGTQVINGSLDTVFSAVPEPSTIALMGLGLMGLGVMRRRKQS